MVVKQRGLLSIGEKSFSGDFRVNGPDALGLMRS